MNLTSSRTKQRQRRLKVVAATRCEPKQEKRGGESKSIGKMLEPFGPSEEKIAF